MSVDPLASAAEPQKMSVRLVERVRKLGHYVVSRVYSSLTRRIIILNFVGLVALLLGFLYLNQFRAGLIDARVQSLLTQGEIIAGAIAASASVDTDTITIDPDKLLQLQAGESSGLNEDTPSPLEFSINPERVAPLLRRLVTPTRTRARVFDREGNLLLDTRSIYAKGDILRLDLPPVTQEEQTLFSWTWNVFKRRFGRADVQVLDDMEPSSARSFPEVQRALNGLPGSIVRVNALGETMVAVAVPVQRQRNIRGVLLLSTQGGDIDDMIEAERFAILQAFLVAAIVMLVLSVLLAGAIAEPIRKLAEAADRVRRGVKSRQEIPDFTGRADEIGHLSGALRDMTQALYRRIEAIESFAADVAHELKNPLTSLRSAVETLPLARNETARDRLMAIIQHDVRRLDRLISDISDASRLDAELARAETEPVDLLKVLKTVVGIFNETKREGQARVELRIEAHALGRSAFFVVGHDSRLGQIFNNLIDNARSFSPENGTVRVSLRRLKKEIEITVEDDGPGIPLHSLERIFERFYTDRPEQGFGQNSGLGLSISRQIVTAHRGKIWAANRMGPPGPDGVQPRLGATFVVRLPCAGTKAS